jgi:hypothetical protein
MVHSRLRPSERQKPKPEETLDEPPEETLDEPPKETLEETPEETPEEPLEEPLGGLNRTNEVNRPDKRDRITNQNLNDLCGRSPTEFHDYCQNLLESQKLIQITDIDPNITKTPEEESLFRLLEEDRERLKHRIEKCGQVLKEILPRKKQIVHFFRALYPTHPDLKKSEEQLQLLNLLYQQLR